MSGRYIFLFVLLFNLPTLFAEQDIIKCFNLIATGKQNHAIKVTNHVKNLLKTNDYSSEQKAILTNLTEIGEYLSLGAFDKRKKLKDFGKSFDVVRPCFTCKGTSVLKKVKRCSDCKVKGICYWCKGQGYRYVRSGNISNYESCDKCEDGNCGVCKGEKYLDGACTKCDSVTGNKLDSLKLKKLLKTMLESYLKAPKQAKELSPKIKDDIVLKPQSTKNRDSVVGVEISTPQVLTDKNVYSGVFSQLGNSLYIITYATSVFDLTKIKCLYNGKIIDHKEIYYSAKYQCYKIKITENVRNLKTAEIDVFRDQTTYVLNSSKDKVEYLKATSNNDLERIYASVGELTIQNRKICGFFAKEKLVDRKNASKWLNQKMFLTKESYLPVKIDFFLSFKLVGKDDLNLDLLFLLQYMEWESEFLSGLEKGGVDFKEGLDKDWLNSLKNSYKSNRWKTDWGKVISLKIIDTINSLESL